MFDHEESGLLRPSMAHNAPDIEGQDLENGVG
jgi:hypothetical protein